MPNPPNPINPNITTGALTGRVVADRYDFQKHIVGEDFRHDGYAVSLTPPITINTIDYTNVHSAISQLANLIGPVVPADATGSVKGIVRLAGDLAGSGTSALNPKVSGLQGIPINTLVPTTGQLLTYNGSAWGPAAPATAFTASGDLEGTNLIQTVKSISGDGSLIKVSSPNLLWSSDMISPILGQSDIGAGAGQDLIVAAQTTTQASQPGGTVRLEGGVGGAGGLSGGVAFNIANARMIHAAEVAAGRKVLALAGNLDVTATQMPANTGDRVIFIEQAASVPTTGIPVGGAILYARSNGLWTKNQDGYDFQIGTNPNPTIWGSATDGQVFEYRTKLSTVSGSTSIAFAKSLLDSGFFSSTIKVEAVVLGRQSSADNASIHNLTHGYVVNAGGTPTAMGTETSTDPRTTAGAAGWTVPTISTSGTTLRVSTGANSATLIYWFVYVKLTVNAL